MVKTWWDWEWGLVSFIPINGDDFLGKYIKKGDFLTCFNDVILQIGINYQHDMNKNNNNNSTDVARLLDNEPVGKTVQVVRVMGDGAFRQRLLEMGFVRGAHVTVLKNAPLQDPVEYMIMGSHISLRHSEADMNGNPGTVVIHFHQVAGQPQVNRLANQVIGYGILVPAIAHKIIIAHLGMRPG